MSYTTVIEGLHAIFATIDGIVGVGLGEPKAIAATPYLYTLLDEVERTPGQLTAMRYRSLHRLCFATQDNEAAETALVEYVNALPAAVDADAQLGGRLSAGIAALSRGQATWVKLNGTLYRCLDYVSDVVEKFPRGADAPIAAGSALLLEDGSTLLLESGERLLLEVG